VTKIVSHTGSHRPAYNWRKPLACKILILTQSTNSSRFCEPPLRLEAFNKQLVPKRRNTRSAVLEYSLALPAIFAVADGGVRAVVSLQKTLL
jgi:hypothetical protein